MAIITIGCIYAGSIAGSATMGAYAAIIFDTIGIFLFSLMGFIPIYIPIIVTIIAALVITALVTRPFSDGGGGV
jgi:hypothetical protein